MTDASHPVFARLSQLATAGPVVVAHRGDSRNHPENTRAAFTAAAALGVAMQEFDVRATRDGALVCIHDAGVDRTTDAARCWGPGALVAERTLTELRALDAGSWRGPAHAGERVPTLAAALTAMLPGCIPMIEHKAGEAAAYIAELDRCGARRTAIVQSFDWRFVAEVHRLAPDIAVAALGPNTEFSRPDGAARTAARHAGAGMLHWSHRELRRADVVAAHQEGLLVCTYTTDDDAGWLGGAAMAIDAICTNDPSHMLALRQGN